ncbi:MAG: transposase [Bacteroidia bacterium]
MIKTQYHRNLPHFQPIGEKFFITFRLYDSFFDKMIEKIIEKKNEKIQLLINSKNENLKEQIRTEQKHALILIDKLLDETHEAAIHLSNDKVAEVVKKKLHEYDNEFYNLIAYCIMPNHVHLVIDTAIQLNEIEEDLLNESYIQLDKIMKYIKGGSAFEANQILFRTGKFWQRESYDHVIRDDRELRNIINYILQNPVKARLVKEWQEWKYSYVNEKYL